MEDIKNLKMYKGMLIVVDMVNGFVTEGALHDTDIGDIIPRQIELIKEAKNQGKLIVFIKDTHTINSTEFNRFGGKEKGAHCVKGTREQELVDEMKEYENDPGTIVIEKNSTSYMEVPEFRLLLEYQKALEEIWVIGCCTDICIINGTIPMSNYFDQWNREVIIKVFEDAIATYGEAARQEYVKASKLLMEQQGIELVKKKVK